MKKDQGLYTNLENAQLCNFKDFMNEHAGLVRKIAHYLPLRLAAHLDTDDLIQAGMIGLVEAYKNYKAEKGANIKTYASIRIRGAMMDELRKQGVLSRSLHRESKRLAEAVRQVEQRQGREAEQAELAQELDLSLEELQKLILESVKSQHSELNCDILDEAEIMEGLIAKIARPDEDLDGQAFSAHLKEALTKLSEREQHILSLYYVEEVNLKEIGIIFGVTESRISQIHTRAMSKLHKTLKEWAEAE